MKTLRFLVREPVVVAVILLNAFALFALASYEPGSSKAHFWYVIDYACVVFFVIEAMAKVRLDGLRRYFASGWNRLDFAVVLISLPFLLTPVFEHAELGGFTALRLLRLFRLLRLLRFIPDRDQLAAGIARSLRASVGVVLGISLVNVILALGASFLFGDLAPEYFGNPFKACYSMFQIFTLEGWHEVPQLIVERSSSELYGWFARCYIVGAVLGGGILGVSLVNAVLVDQMVLDNNSDLEVRVGELVAEVRALRELIEQRGQDI